MTPVSMSVQALALCVVVMAELVRAGEAEPGLCVSVTLSPKIRAELEAVPRDSEGAMLSTRWLEFVNEETSAVRDALVLIRVQQSGSERIDPVVSAQSQVTINENGDWEPRIVLMSPGEHLDVSSERSESLYRLALPSRAAPRMKQFGAQNDGRCFEKGTVSRIGPYAETLAPIAFWDAARIGPAHRSKNGFIFVSSAAMKGVTDDAGQCQFASVGSNAIEVRLWHELLGWVEIVSIGDRSVRMNEEWLTPARMGREQRLELEIPSLHRMQK